MGAQKAGSSFLHYLLAQGPEVSTYRGKEPHFFSSSLHDGDFSSIFPALPSASVWLDSSTSYLHTPTAAQAIQSAFGRSAPIVVVIRDPVERAISAWLHSVKHGRDIRSAKEAMTLNGTSYAGLYAEEGEAAERALAQGLIAFRPPRRGLPGDRDYHDSLYPYRYASNSFYAEQIARYDALFDQLLIVDFEDLVADPIGLLSRLRPVLKLVDAPVNIEVARNPTRVKKRQAALRYARNVAEEHGRIAALKGLIHSSRRLSRISLATREIGPAVEHFPWVSAARASYNLMRARRI